jgi:phosphoenolpyruvate carboxylase
MPTTRGKYKLKHDKQNKTKENKTMTTVNQQKEMFYSAAILSNIEMLAAKVGRTYDFKYLTTCEDSELRDLQDNLIEEYNRKVAK